MVSRRSHLYSLLLSSAVVAAAWLPLASAQDAPADPGAAPTAANGAANAGGALATLAEDFLHYSIVGNEELAKANAEALLNANAEPTELLAAFENAAEGRDVRGVLIRNQRNEQLKDVSQKLLEQFEEGQRASARNPKRIEAEIERLDDGPRAYANAKERLTAAGQFAVPYYIRTLQDNKKEDLHPYVIRVMTEIGRPLVNPLVQQLQTPDANEKVQLISVLGDIRYPQALPYLKALASDENAPSKVREAAKAAIGKIDPRGQYANLSASNAFLQKATEHYAGRPSVAPQYPNEATNPVWFYDSGLNNVVAAPVPTPIFDEVEAMRAAERALKLEKEKPGAISLWLAANLRRELQLPAGQVDPTRPENAPDAAYYARAAGPVYVNPVLSVALQDRDTGLVLKAIEALEATGGIQGLVSSTEGGTPLVKALSFPDRAVRFAAAFALAKANPDKQFPGYHRVVPVLAEAISQTGTPNVILINPDEQTRNRLKAALGSSYNVYDAATLNSALEVARKSAAFDLVILPAGDEVSRLQELARTDYRLVAPPVLVTAQADQLPGVKAALVNLPGTFQTIDVAVTDQALAESITNLKTSGTPIDQTAATTYAGTAIGLLNTLAVDHASIYAVSDAQPTLVDALKDKRPEIALASAAVLGKLNSGEAQKAIANAALGEGVAADPAARAALLTALAESAKRTGNTLGEATINSLIKTVATETDPAVRQAAATALGALNVPSNQASTLILQQAR